MRLMTAFLDLAIQPFFRQLLFIGMSFLTLNCDVEHWPRHPCTDALLFFSYCPTALFPWNSNRHVLLMDFCRDPWPASVWIQQQSCSGLEWNWKRLWLVWYFDGWAGTARVEGVFQLAYLSAALCERWIAWRVWYSLRNGKCWRTRLCN